MVKRETVPAPPPPEPRAGRGGAAEDEDTPSSSVELRLTIGREGVGVELAQPRALGPVVVTELATALPGARFPLDVSGGVARFRHQRGRLERLTLEVRAEDAARAAAPRLRGLIGPRTPGVRLLARPWGAVVCVYEKDDAARPLSRPRKALAFDAVVEPRGASIALHVVRARGWGVAEPPSLLAIAAAEALLGDLARREGARLVAADLAARLTRALLPDAGARAPDVSGVRWSAVTSAADAWILHASDGAEAAPAPEAVRAREATALLERADELLARRSLDRARAAALEVLERAPGHAEACARVAEIDAHAGGRAEAALATLAEARAPEADAGHLGLLAGALHLERGDAPAGVAALARAAELEPAPELAAAALAAAAEALGDPHEALAWLDRAIARDPGSPSLRWRRARRRLEVGRLADALADVEHLEALARGPAARHGVWRAAAEAWTAAGLAGAARAHWERALRYMPDDPEAQLGLARALLASAAEDEPWAGARGVALMTRALDALSARALARARGEARVGGASRAPEDDAADAATVELARALAQHVGDRPAAIARLRAVRDGSPSALEARGLEGRLRRELGDLVGATLAWARLRDLALARAATAPTPRSILELIAEAAEHERARGDLPAAQALLGAALHLAPRDAGVLAAYRAVGAALARAPEPAPAPAAAPASPEELEARADELARRYHATPDDDAIADELGDVLARLGRAHDLVALLFGRLEGAPARREALEASARATLARLEAEARRGGHPAEGDIYAEALAALSER